MSEIFDTIEDIEYKKIDREKLKTQGTGIQKNLAYEQAVYRIISNKIDALNNDKNISGDAVDGYKYQMSTYHAVLDGLCAANELDIYSINKVNSILDADLADHSFLDGSEILANLKAAKDAVAYDEQKIEENANAIRNLHWYQFWMVGYYTDMINYYTRKESDDQKDVDTFKALAELFVSVNNKLDPLCKEGDDYRQVVKEGINALKTSFDEETGTYIVGDSSWKDKLTKMLEDAVINDDGSVNLDLVEQILSKDSDAISESEYAIVAYAYTNIDVEQMDEFYMMLEVPEDVDQAKWNQMYVQGDFGPGNQNGILGNVVYSNDAVFTIDSKKVKNICKQMNIYQTVLLAESKSEELTDAEKKQALELRDKTIQRITLANTIDSINTFYYNKESDCFEFSLEKKYGSDDCIVAKYYGLNKASGGWDATLADHSFSVSRTLTNTEMDIFSTDDLKNASLNALTSGGGTIVSQDISNQILSDIISKGGEVGGTVGGMFTFGLGIISDLNENQTNRQFIDDTWKADEIVDMANVFDCEGNIVVYDDNKVDISLYEGKHTAERVAQVEEVAGDDVNTEKLYTEPYTVFEEVRDYMEKDSSNGKIIDEIADGDYKSNGDN